MKILIPAAIAALLAAASLAQADEAKDPDVKARQGLMKMMAQSTKVLGEMAGGKAPYDAAKAAEAKATLVEHADAIPATFKSPADDPDSEAKRTIWSDWDGFTAKAGVLQAAAKAVDVSSAETIGAGMGDIGGACKGCHQEYRAKK